MIQTIFYIFLGFVFLFYFYVIIGHIINKKRKSLIQEMESDYTRSKFNKCPNCGVLNSSKAKVCKYCNRELPRREPEPETQPGKEGIPPGEEPPEVQAPPKISKEEKPPVAPPGKPVKPSKAAKPSAAKNLEKFPYKYVWPTPSGSAIITISISFFLIIAAYGFFVGIYNLGKRGVEQLNEVTKGMGNKQAQSAPAYPQQGVSRPMQQVPPQQQSAPPAPRQSHPVRTPTPVPSPTSFDIQGSPEERADQLMLFLESEDWNVAKRAKKYLVQIGERAVPALVKEIDHPDSRVRTRVITSLGSIGSPEAAPALIDALKSDNTVTVIQSAAALGNIKAETVVPPLVKLLQSSDWRVRRAAVISLGKTGDSSVIEDLNPLLQDQNEEVADAARNAIDNIRNE